MSEISNVHSSFANYTDKLVGMIGSRIADKRKSMKMSMAELAEATGVERKTISRIENGNANVNVGTVFRVALYLGIYLVPSEIKMKEQAAA